MHKKIKKIFILKKKKKNLGVCCCHLLLHHYSELDGKTNISSLIDGGYCNKFFAADLVVVMLLKSCSLCGLNLRQMCTYFVPVQIFLSYWYTLSIEGM